MPWEKAYSYYNIEHMFGQVVKENCPWWWTVLSC